ncbi:MAG TPA: glycosyltransferase family 2 protein [Patescibacteria group bacterium]|nr:glycosyltransferase family 2 protein [Patescibacteria group bacterium]
MKISVVVPAYNEEKYIRKCLQSLIDQEEKPDEIIVVDNNCKDKTVEICKNFPVRIVREKKLGIIAARNKGFNSALYNIIARCDADSIASPDWTKKIKENFKTNSIVALSGPVKFYDFPLKSTMLSNGYSTVVKRIYKNHVLIGANMALRKSAWEKIRNEAAAKDSHVHEDVDITMLAGKVGNIGFDKKMIMLTSARRMKKRPHSFFVQYPVRLLKTYRRHSKISKSVIK